MEKRTFLIFSLIILTIVSQVQAYEFCDEGTQGKTNLRIISVDDMLESNSREWYWEAEQDIELEIRVENKEDSTNDYKAEIIFLDEEEDSIRVAEDNDDLEKEFSLSSDERKSIVMNFKVDEDTKEDEYDMYVKVYKDGNEDSVCLQEEPITITIEKIEICDDEKVDDDELEITSITDEKEDNDEEWSWTPGDDIEISVDLENKDYSERNFIVELVMLDEDNNEIDFAKDSGDLEEETELDEDESDTVKFSFTLDNDFDEGSYTLYAKAYDEDDSDICTSLKAEESTNPITVEVEKEERRVIISEVKGPETVEFSKKLEYSITVENLGRETEDKVAAIVYITPLKIREVVEISDLESGETKTVNISVKIPENATSISQKAIFSTEYEYDNKKDIYRSESKDSEDKKLYITLLKSTTEIEEEGTKTEENITKEVNETIIEEENTQKPEETVISGNVVGKSSNKPNWLVILGLIALAGVGVFFFTKKPKKIKDVPVITPNVNIARRYTARLND